ncbi:MAG: phosphatidylinositol transfer protein [Polyangiaceae bacterium]
MRRLTLLSGAAAVCGALFILAGCSDDTPEGGGGSGATAQGGSADGGSPNGGSPGTGGNPGQGGGGAPNVGGAGGSGSGGAPPTPCPDVLSCNAAYPDVGAARDWVHFGSSVTAATGFANHRGRDMFYNPGDTIWVMGKFAYGVFDDDIQDEDVDVYLNEDCGPNWQLLDTVRTTTDGLHATVEGVEDTGGWVYYQLPSSIQLSEGRHRFLLVVAGDLSTTEVYVDIVKPGTPLIVSDVDGTLTTTENEEFTALLTGSLPDANPSAPEVLTALAEHGYRIFYLTARPHFLGGRTREFLDAHNFPLGLVHTTLTFTGATGSSAVTYKSDELAAIAQRGLVPAWAFGNTASDAEAYDNAGITPLNQRIMFQFTDDVFGARRIESYADLLPEALGLPDAVCP